MASDCDIMPVNLSLDTERGMKLHKGMVRFEVEVQTQEAHQMTVADSHWMGLQGGCHHPCSHLVFQNPQPVKTFLWDVMKM